MVLSAIFLLIISDTVGYSAKPIDTINKNVAIISMIFFFNNILLDLWYKESTHHLMSAIKV